MTNLLIRNKNCLTSSFCRFLLFFTCFLLSINTDAQNQLWTPISENLLSKKKSTELQDFSLFSLDKPLFLSSMEGETSSARQFTLQLPIPFGERKMTHLTLTNAPIIAEGLTNKYPAIQTFKVVETANSLMQGRISWVNGTLYGHLIQDEQSFFIENVQIEGYEDAYLFYKEVDLKTSENTTLACGNNLLEKFKKDQPIFNQTATDSLFDTNLKVFRLAITATEGFTNASGGTIETALAAIVRALTSLNVIYEKDTGIRFVLHEDNNQLIFTDSMPSPYSDSEDAFGLWWENAFLLDSLLGNENYDLGHVFAAECTGGVSGLAALASVCSTKNKARAASCVFNENLGTFRTTLYHEIGHQLGANHTWSNCGVFVNEGQRSAATAVEPGSGSTIMSYGGVCGPFDIVATAQDNLHGISIQEIKSALLSDSIGCYQLIPTENTSPTISVIESGFTIPIATPFELNAIVTDIDNTTLTYSWEQFDTGAVSQIGFPIENAPSFRAYSPVRESERIFPRVNDIILNKSSDVEVLPDTTRMLTFGVTVRDNDERGGSTAFSEVMFFASAEAGPFTVLQPDSANIEYAPTDSISILWDVGNTDVAPVNCALVDVYLSFDNGKEFNHLLAEAIPNNGETRVVLPDTTTTRARIKIKCSDNIFFDMSNNRFKITAPIISSTQQLYTAPIQLFPNPTRNKLMVLFPEILNEEIDLMIFDALGQIVQQEHVNANTANFSISMDGLPMGVYYLKGSINDQFFSKKIIKHE